MHLTVFPIAIVTVAICPLISHLQMVMLMLDTWSMTRCTAKDFINGQMATVTMAIGKTVRCTAKAFTNVQTVPLVRETLSMIFIRMLPRMLPRDIRRKKTDTDRAHPDMDR